MIALALMMLIHLLIKYLTNPFIYVIVIVRKNKLDIKIPSTPVKAPYSDIPVTEEEIQKRKVRLTRLEEIGASCTKFDGEMKQKILIGCKQCYIL